jgi:hypothetical protein
MLTGDVIAYSSSVDYKLLISLIPYRKVIWGLPPIDKFVLTAYVHNVLHPAMCLALQIHIFGINSNICTHLSEFNNTVFDVNLV